jgi:uncharacterized membrane protein
MQGLLSITNKVAPWRFWMFFLLIGIAGFFALPALGWSTGVLVSFDIAAAAFLISCLHLFGHGVANLREAAKANDANRGVLLAISVLLTGVILAAVMSEIAQRDRLQWTDKSIIAVSLVVTWLFANAVYTLHYAHLYYTRDDGGKDCAGLIFPATKLPVMSDFVYFAYTLGVAVQTSDVQVTNRHFRGVVTAHCVAGFFFNLGVLALTINVLGSG